MNKTCSSIHDAVADIANGSMIAIGGFGNTGAPVHLMKALLATSVTDVELVSNNGGLYDWALGPLLAQHRVRRVIATHIGGNRDLEAAFRAGEVEIELVPQGTFVERLRAGGAGVPAFYSASGVDTLYESGMPWRYDADGTVAVSGPPKIRAEFDGRAYLLERSIRPDVALVRAARGDRFGNLQYAETAQNFNPAFASAARLTIAEVEELVEPGELDPSHVHTPGIFVDRIVEVGTVGKWYERLTERGDGDDLAADDPRAVIARRAALDLQPGEYVNLGIGIPVLIPRFLAAEDDIQIHSENGIVGLGPAPLPGEASYDLVNASKQTATITAGGSFCDSSTSFAMIRGGHVDATVLGAMQVSQHGDIANWMVPGRSVVGIGGAMDLVAGAGRVIVAMTHTDGSGAPKIVESCTFPLTGKGVVDRIITELAVFDVTADGLVLQELAPGVSVDDVRQVTPAPFDVSRSPVAMRTRRTPSVSS